MLVILLVFSIVLNGSLAIVAVVKNRISDASVFHFLATFFFSLWAVSNVVAERYNGNIERNIFFNQLAFLSVYLAMLSLLLFCRSYASPFIRKKWSVSKKISIATSSLLIGTVIPTSLIAGTVERQGGQLIFLQGPLIPLYFVIFIVLFAIAIKYLLVRVKYGNYAQKNQARFIISGLVFALLSGTVITLLIPAFKPAYNTGGAIVTFLTIVIALPTSYALIKHRLLDIRPLVARSTALLLLFVTLGAVYGLALVNLNLIFVAELQPSAVVVSSYAFIMVILGFLFNPLYKLYNRIAGRLFLHRIYDSQNVINELNNVLVANLKIQALIPELQKVIRTNLGGRFTIIKLHHRDAMYHQGITKVPSRGELAEIDLLAYKTLRTDKQILSIRDIAFDYRNKDLTNLMIKHNLAVIAMIKQGKSPLGYMYISNKTSELPYTNQDLEIIKIIISQAGLAIQNALLYHEVSTLNATLQQRVEDATRELRVSNAKLVELDKSKDDFISIASHQLRTPLTTIKGYLSMLLEGDLGKIDSAQRNILQQSFDSSQRMAYVVSDLLNLTRIRTGKFALNPTPVNLADVVESEVTYLIEQSKYKNLHLIYKKPNNFPVLMMDDTKIRQVIKNFIYNGLFYTPVGGTVDVALSDHNGRIIFQVIDTGIGVPAKDHKHLFTQFYRAKNAQEIRPDGTGIGLYIAKKIVTVHGGSVLFESVEGKGSTFGFNLSKKHLSVDTAASS